MKKETKFIIALSLSLLGCAAEDMVVPVSTPTPCPKGSIPVRFTAPAVAIDSDGNNGDIRVGDEACLIFGEISVDGTRIECSVVGPDGTELIFGGCSTNANELAFKRLDR